MRYPHSSLDEAFRLASVDKSAAPLEQGLQLVLQTMQALVRLYEVLEPPAAGDTET